MGKPFSIALAAALMILFGPCASAWAEHRLDGTWTEVEEGCGSPFGDAQLQKLALGGRTSRYRRGVLTISGNSYTVRMMRGSGCFSNFL